MTSTTQSVIEDLVTKVRELARLRPDNVYHAARIETGFTRIQCTYLGGTCSDGTVGCLIGQALIAIGFTADRLRAVNAVEITEALEDLFPLEFSETDAQRVRWLGAVQEAQDNSHTWLKAVEIADREEPL